MPLAPELKCSCCYRAFRDPVTLHCGHSLCRACAVRWFTEPSKLCPIGRCAASANCEPAALPTAYALRDVVDSLRVHCRYGLYKTVNGDWAVDVSGCPKQMRPADAAAHEKTCEHAMMVCPFAGCGANLRRMDAAVHNFQAAVQHAAGEHNARLALQASAQAALAKHRKMEVDLRQECDEALSQLETLHSTLIQERTSRAALESKTSNDLVAHNASVRLLRQERDAARLEVAKLKRERDALSALKVETPSKGDAQPPASKKRRTTAMGASAGVAPLLQSRHDAAAPKTTRSGRRVGPV